MVIMLTNVAKSSNQETSVTSTTGVICLGLDGPGSDKIEIFVEDLAVLFLILLRFQIERLIKTLGSVLTLFVVGDCVVDMNLW